MSSETEYLGTYDGADLTSCSAEAAGSASPDHDLAVTPKTWIIDSIPCPCALVTGDGKRRVLAGNRLFHTEFGAQLHSRLGSILALSHAAIDEQTSWGTDDLGRCYLILQKPYEPDPSLQLALLIKASLMRDVGSTAPPTRSTAPRLTSREHQIIGMVTEGQLSKTIAYRLGISVKTVEAHRASLMRKLGVNNKIQLVRTALSLGLIGTA